MEPKAGDYVEIELLKTEKGSNREKTEDVKGTIIHRPELLKGDFLILKLDNGYNIGVSRSKIKKINMIRQYQQTPETKHHLQRKPNLPDVAVMSTGGTISSKIDYKTGGVYANYTAEDFAQMCPEILDVANIEAEKVMSVMSEDLMPADWKKMAKEIAKKLNSNISGAVITHGTDTMHFSSAAMSFFLKNLSKPVVFTGSQRSIDRGSSDAFMNLICSTVTAAKYPGAEVGICMHGTTNDDYCIFNRGTKVRKMHTSRRDAFRPINDKPLAKIWKDGKIEATNKNYKQRNKQDVEVDDKFEEKTALVAVYPGMDPEIIDFYLDKGYKGIVLSATALGHVPTVIQGRTLIPKLERAKEMKIPVVVASQTIYGRVHPFVYTNLRKLSVGANAIFAEDMLPEVAYIKLGWTLGHTKDIDEVKKMMLTNYAGELTKRTETDNFLI
ncbi:MAG: Glu-tRNA(Gln) amidotransferase subunit GatD [Nanoarchaeota archaeon]|nr:Glu-tRNA(Gln) amidotransferase subunit GatD [Nanoarchaeota archaeon]